jgi:outer membrane lipopolysaccharide assembly protein LptE/RlpB
MRSFGKVRATLGPASLVLLVVLAESACGYSLAGRGNFLPSYIKTIGVPQFTNHSTVAGLDLTLTTEVRSQFVNRGKRVVPDTDNVDAVCTATISSVTTTPTAFTTSRQASKYAIVITADVQFIDKHDNDKVLWVNHAVQVRDEYDATSSTTPNDPSAFLAGNANALERLAQAFAQTVVTSILEAF